MSKVINISGSYVQDQKHSKVSDRFNVIQASSVGDAMASHGLSLVSLSTGRAKHADKADFQRTLSRYRGPEIADGVFLDIVYSSKHMGRGVDCLYVGIFRSVCTNGLFTGTSFFQHNVRHSGNTYDNLNLGIAAALGMQGKLADTIKRLQGIVLTPEQRELLALEAVKLLTPEKALQVKHRLLKSTGRIEDSGLDAWTSYNVIQENGMQGNNIAYTLNRTDLLGRDNVRHMAARPIKTNSVKDAEFNQGLFDAVLKIAA